MYAMTPGIRQQRQHPDPDRVPARLDAMNDERGLHDDRENAVMTHLHLHAAIDIAPRAGLEVTPECCIDARVGVVRLIEQVVGAGEDRPAPGAAIDAHSRARRLASV